MNVHGSKNKPHQSPENTASVSILQLREGTPGNATCTKQRSMEGSSDLLDVQVPQLAPTGGMQQRGLLRGPVVRAEPWEHVAYPTVHVSR